ncbi:unnamed protein product [Schistosoma curassoni]|uniref:Endo/exonuclease/phosphatase domain-containing protein n=1 Tax=Schistosoma curassoni TaxID=6186 RepID=A0A183KUQ8_9TREM|nr:unnamed protein product [Schistosoma curassoni]
MGYQYNIGDLRDQSKSCGNDEIQLGRSQNQRNPLDLGWTTKVSYESAAAVPWTRRLSKEARVALIGRKSHGPRIIKASFKTKKERFTMNAIQCYAQTNHSNDDDKYEFYLRLQSIISKCAGNNMTILMADLNAENRNGQHRI